MLTPIRLEPFKVACSSCNLRELCLPLGLSPSQVERLDELVATRRPIARGEALFRQGDPEFSPAEVGALAEHALRRARLTHAPGCGLCGSRRKHVPVWGLGMRVCASCLKVNLVSSTSLFHEYGLDYTKHLDKIVGKVYFFHNTSGNTFAGQYLSDNPLDFRGSGKWGAVFFWLPHLRKAVDLEASWASHRSTARRAAARRLTSPSLPTSWGWCRRFPRRARPPSVPACPSSPRHGRM